MALVTGASRGIGRSIAEILAEATAGGSMAVNLARAFLEHLLGRGAPRWAIGPVPHRALRRPEEVAREVRFLVAEAPDYLAGEFISLRGGRL